MVTKNIGRKFGGKPKMSNHLIFIKVKKQPVEKQLWTLEGVSLLFLILSITAWTCTLKQRHPSLPHAKNNDKQTGKSLYLFKGIQQKKNNFQKLSEKHVGQRKLIYIIILISSTNAHIHQYLRDGEMEQS